MIKVKKLLKKIIPHIHKAKIKQENKNIEDLDSIEALIAKYEELLGR